MVPERYSRQLPLLTEEGQDRLAQSRVLLVGCGGLGGHLLENMLRVGVGSLLAVDPDRFEASDLNRQLLSTVSLLGAFKAEAAAARAKAIDPALRFRALPVSFSEENGDELVQGCDLVLDGLDNVPARLLLEDICARHGVPLVHGAIDGELVQVAVVPPGSGMLRMLYGRADAETRAPASIAYTPACCAAIQSAQAVKLLLGERPSLWGKVLQLHVETMRSDILSLL